MLMARAAIAALTALAFLTGTRVYYNVSMASIVVGRGFPTYDRDLHRGLDRHKWDMGPAPPISGKPAPAPVPVPAPAPGPVLKVLL